MLEIQPLLTAAVKHFLTSRNIGDINEQEVEAWLQHQQTIASTSPVPTSLLSLLNSRKWPVIPMSYPLREVRGIVGLDPATGGVILAGLTALLTYLATERRHRETMGGKQPPDQMDAEQLIPERCEHTDAHGNICGLPVKETKIIRSTGHAPYLLRICSREPEPHLVPGEYSR